MLVAIKLYLKHVLKLGVKGNYQIFPVESRGIDFVGYVFRHDYIRVRKGIKNSCRIGEEDMITQRKTIIPIFNYKLTIVIFDRWEELEGSIPQDEMDTGANAITISAYGASLVAVNSRRGSSIVHEAEHIKNHIWQYIGHTPQRDNDEVDAYLLTYIYDKITQVFYKHKDNKE